MRCSRCTHAFFIAAPGSGEADGIDEVVAEVTGPGETPAPDAASDLLDSNPEEAEMDLRGNTEPVEFDAEDRSSGDFEEDWEFNDDSPAQAQVEAEPEFPEISQFDTTALDLAGEAPPSETATDDEDSIEEPDTDLSPVEKSPVDPVKEPSIDPVESIRARDAGLDFSSPDDLGSPADWDFVGTAEAEPPFELTPEDEASEPVFGKVDESGSAPHSPVQAEAPTGTTAAAEEPDRDSLAARFARVGIDRQLGGRGSCLLGGDVGSVHPAGRGRCSERRTGRDRRLGPLPHRQRGRGPPGRECPGGKPPGRLRGAREPGLGRVHTGSRRSRCSWSPRGECRSTEPRRPWATPLPRRSFASGIRIAFARIWSIRLRRSPTDRFARASASVSTRSSNPFPTQRRDGCFRPLPRRFTRILGILSLRQLLLLGSDVDLVLARDPSPEALDGLAQARADLREPPRSEEQDTDSQNDREARWRRVQTWFDSVRYRQ